MLATRFPGSFSLVVACALAVCRVPSGAAEQQKAPTQPAKKAQQGNPSVDAQPNRKEDGQQNQSDKGQRNHKDAGQQNQYDNGQRNRKDDGQQGPKDDGQKGQQDGQKESKSLGRTKALPQTGPQYGYPRHYVQPSGPAAEL